MIPGPIFASAGHGQEGESMAEPTTQQRTASNQAVSRPDIHITSLRLRVDAVDAIVLSPTGLTVSSAAARRADTAFPKLVSHVCVSGGHQRFGEEIIGTEPAHLVEHLAIELMVQTAAFDERERSKVAIPDRQLRADHTYTGHTSQVNRLPSDDPAFDPYQVSISYDNDLVAIRALRYACDIASWIMSADNDPNGPSANIPSFAGVLKELLRLYRS